MTTMGEAAVLSCVKNGVATLVLNRAEAINAINDAIRTGLPEAVRSADKNPDARAIVIRGNGPRGFCVGADVKEQRAEETPIQARRRLDRTDWISAVAAAEKPVIAAIHGFCLGAGLELALAADIRIASADAALGLPETALGLIPGGGGTQRLPRLIGQGRALDLMLTGDRVGGEEALGIGLVTRLVATAAELPDAAQALAERIAMKPPVATCAVKEAVHGGAQIDLASGLRLERGIFTLLLGTEDRKEAAAAFREKRKPAFTGR